MSYVACVSAGCATETLVWEVKQYALKLILHCIIYSPGSLPPVGQLLPSTHLCTHIGVVTSKLLLFYSSIDGTHCMLLHVHHNTSDLI